MVWLWRLGYCSYLASSQSTFLGFLKYMMNYMKYIAFSWILRFPVSLLLWGSLAFVRVLKWPFFNTFSNEFKWVGFPLLFHAFCNNCMALFHSSFLIFQFLNSCFWRHDTFSNILKFGFLTTIVIDGYIEPFWVCHRQYIEWFGSMLANESNFCFNIQISKIPIIFKILSFKIFIQFYKFSTCPRLIAGTY